GPVVLGKQSQLRLGAGWKLAEIDPEQPTYLTPRQSQAHVIAAPELHRHRARIKRLTPTHVAPPRAGRERNRHVAQRDSGYTLEKMMTFRGLVPRVQSISPCFPLAHAGCQHLRGGKTPMSQLSAVTTPDPPTIADGLPVRVERDRTLRVKIIDA